MVCFFFLSILLEWAKPRAGWRSDKFSNRGDMFSSSHLLWQNKYFTSFGRRVTQLSRWTRSIASEFPQVAYNVMNIDALG